MKDAGLIGLCLFVVIIFTGCATNAQREAARIQSVQVETKNSAEACFDSETNKPKYARLKTKTPLSTDPNFTLEMLNDTAKPRKSDIALLYQLHDDLQPCRKITLDGASRANALVMLALVKSYSESDKLWADATSGKLSWGAFNQGRKDIYARARERMVEAHLQIGTQLENQNRYEIAQRQRAAEAFQQWAHQQQQLYQQQQAINAINRPRMINCNYYGNSAQCTSF